jgi:hypothetical protein
MDFCYGSTQCSPSSLIHRKRYGLLAISNQVGAEDGTHTHRFAGALELDRSIDSVGVGAGEGAKASLGC